MGKYLLFTDTHWDENPANEYRWRAFDNVHRLLDEHADVEGVFHLGDAWDRSDRFSGEFVNRLIRCLDEVGDRRPLWVLRGNHDLPLRGPAFFEFLNRRPGRVTYVTAPTAHEDLILLPFSRDPVSEWCDVDFTRYRAALMHVTVTGAISESGHGLSGVEPGMLPRELRLYSGDVHNPQTIRNLTYVGCPHPVKFGDRFQPRMLLIDSDTMGIILEVPVDTVRKLVLDVSGIDDLREIDLRPGDQVRIRTVVPPGAVEQWASTERGIAEFLRSAGASLAGVEATVETASRGDASGPDMDPEAILRQFAEEDGVSSAMLDLGMEIMREATI